MSIGSVRVRGSVRARYHLPEYTMRRLFILYLIALISGALAEEKEHKKHPADKIGAKVVEELKQDRVYIRSYQDAT